MHLSIAIICRDLEQGHYLVVSIQPSNNQNECLGSYLYLFSQTKEAGKSEQIWRDLTRQASIEDWAILDEILINTSIEKMLCFDVEQIESCGGFDFFLDQADEFMSQHGDNRLPVLIALDRDTDRVLCAVLKHSNGFAAHVIVCDNRDEILLSFNDLAEAHGALCICMGLRHAYIPFEDTLARILRGVEDGEIDTDILDQLNESDREEVERIILERKDIILLDEFISDLKTLSAEEIEIIVKRSSQKKGQ